MKPLSLKLRDDIFTEVERIIRDLRLPRNTYINQAVDFYNQLQHRKRLRRQLHQESQLVRHSSLQALEELERLADELPE